MQRRQALLNVLVLRIELGCTLVRLERIRNLVARFVQRTEVIPNLAQIRIQLDSSRVRVEGKRVLRHSSPRWLQRQVNTHFDSLSLSLLSARAGNQPGWFGSRELQSSTKRSDFGRPCTQLADSNRRPSCSSVVPCSIVPEGTTTARRCGLRTESR